MKWKLGIGGLVALTIAALTVRLGCQANLEVSVEDVTPAEARMGWDQAAAQSEATQQLVATMPPFAIEGVWRDNTHSDVRLWHYAKQIGIELPTYRQQVGDCVSFGAHHAVNCLQCVQIAFGHRSEFHDAFPPYLYGISRVQIGGGRLSGDGSVGAWAARGVQEYGVLASNDKGVPAYSGSVAREWGRSGPPKELISIARERLVKTVSPVRSAQDVCDAITNGYPCTIASNAGFGSITERDGRMVGRWTTSWNHQMAIIGYDGDEPSGERFFYVQNSWGPTAHPKPLGDEPPGGFWITWSDCDRIVKQGDSFAFSSFVGFPSQDLDFDVIEAGAFVTRATIQGKDYAVETILLCSILASVVIVSVGVRQYRRYYGLAMVAILTTISVQPAQAEDLAFDVIEAPVAIAFDVIEQTDTQVTLVFSVIEPVCNCQQSCICRCLPGECKCENCPDHRKLKDNRPVITVKTRPNCAPCERAKHDAKELATEFNFVFVEQDGPAPVVEWQGIDNKWTFDGWHGIDFFRRTYEKSQKPSKKDLVSFIKTKPAPSFVPFVRMPSMPMSSCGSCCR